MAREVNRLSAAQERTITESGRRAEGAGLCLTVTAGPAGLRRRWVFPHRFGGKLRLSSA